MSSHQVFNTTERSIFGGKASAKYRQQGLVPVSICRSGAESQHVLVTAKEAEAMAGLVSQVVVLVIGDQRQQAVVKSFDRHPLSDQLLSLQLLAVTDEQLVTVAVRVSVNPNADSPGLRAGGLLEQMMRRVVLKLPVKDIPAAVEADLTGAELGQTIYAEQLALPANATLITRPRAAVLTIIRTRGMRRAASGAAEQ